MTATNLRLEPSQTALAAQAQGTTRRGVLLAALSACAVVAGCSRTEPAAQSQAQPQASSAAAASAAPEAVQLTVNSSLHPDTVGETAAKSAGKPLEAIYAAISSNMYGFRAGKLTDKRTVYVLFDPQCHHCGRLWMESIRLQEAVQFVWIPVSGRQIARAQGAMILASPNPIAAMHENEKLLLDGKGGLQVNTQLASMAQSQVEHNVDVAIKLKVQDVPFILYKRPDGEIRAIAAGLSAEQLAQFIGA